MEKMIEEDELKGLEAEIDSAVDRLFVEKKKRPEEAVLTQPTPPVTETPRMEPPTIEPSFKIEPKIEQKIEPKIEPRVSFEPPPPPSPPKPPSVSPMVSKSIDRMESQLLSLEWEITKENIVRAKEEVLTVQGIMEGKADIKSVLSFMEKILSHMIQNEESIRPPLIKFLLDSKETIKLLMRKAMDSETEIYKQLAYAGIEARYLSLEGWKGVKEQPSPREEEGVERAAIPAAPVMPVEEMLSRMNIFSTKMDEVLHRIDQQLSRLGEVSRISSEGWMEKRPLPVDITVFKIDEKLFGIESHKVYKLFKLPTIFQDKYSSQPKIRLKDVEVRMVDWKKIFAIRERGRKGEIKILTVKDNGDYKGLMVDQVLKKLLTHSEVWGDYGEYFSGMIRWTYQDRPVEVPILNLKKI